MSIIRGGGSIGSVLPLGAGSLPVLDWGSAGGSVSASSLRWSRILNRVAASQTPYINRPNPYVIRP